MWSVFARSIEIGDKYVPGSALGVQATAYSRRLARDLYAAWREHTSDPRNRAAWLVLCDHIAEELRRGLTNSWTLHCKDTLDDVTVDGRTADSTVLLAKFASIASAAGSSAFVTRFATYLISLPALTSVVFLVGGLAVLSKFGWLALAIAVLAHHVANPLRTARPLLLFGCSAQVVLAAGHLSTALGGTLASRLLLVLPVALGVVFACFAADRLSANSKRSIVEARRSLAARLRLTLNSAFVATAAFAAWACVTNGQSGVRLGLLISFLAICVLGFGRSYEAGNATPAKQK